MGIISVGIDNPITLLRKPANEVINNQSEIINLDDYFAYANLNFPAIDALYEAELLLNYTGNASGGIKTKWIKYGSLTFETLRSISGPAWSSISSSNTHAQFSRINCDYNAEYGASASMASIEEKFYFSTSSSGSDQHLGFAWAQYVAHVSNLTVYAQSTLKITRIE